MSPALPLHWIQTPFVFVMFTLSVHPVKPTEAKKAYLYKATKAILAEMQREMGML